MKLENARLLIVVENADYREHVIEALQQPYLSDLLPEALPQSLVQHERAIPFYILSAASYWQTQTQAVAIFSLYSEQSFSEICDVGIRLMGSGITSPTTHKPNGHKLNSHQPSTQAPNETTTAPLTPQTGQAQTVSFQPANWLAEKLMARQSTYPLTPPDGFTAAFTADTEAAPIASVTSSLFKSQPDLSEQPDSETLHRNREAIRLIADFCPTHLVMCTPNANLLRWANRNQIPSIVLISDWQEPLGWRQRWQHNRLIKQLNHKSVAWVGSQGTAACKILADSGIQRRKLIPWEWPETHAPSPFEPKKLRYEQESIELIYAGPLQDSPDLFSTGVPDLLMAMSHLQKRGHTVRLQLVNTPADGIGDKDINPSAASIYNDNLLQSQDLAGQQSRQIAQATDPALPLIQLQSQIHQLNLDEWVTLVPALTHEQLLDAMREADLVILPRYNPSQAKAINESLRLAMTALTPIVAAEHPHLRQQLLHSVNAMTFPSGNAKSMAHRIERIMNQPQLYAQLSEALGISLKNVKVPAHWANLTDHWLNSAQDMPSGMIKYQQLCNWTLSSGRYQASSRAKKQTGTAGTVRKRPSANTAQPRKAQSSKKQKAWMNKPG
jgi:glycosyltransferase involved in cell wall biosynthesis